MAQTLSIKDLELEGKKALVRVDFNVPLDKEGHITDDTRIVASLPTIRYIIDSGGACILMSHLGRPTGKDPALSLAPCAERLSKLIHADVVMAPDCVGPEVEALVKKLKPGQVLVLENLRFYEAEKKPEKDPSFAEKLATLGDLYINDAFGSAHRNHSSTATIARFFPGKAASGFLMEKEIAYLGEALLTPKRPFYAIIGGAKVSTKLGVLGALMEKVDALFLGGAMAYTFLKAKGIAVGNSLVEDDMIGKAKDLLDRASKNHVKLFLPEDNVIASSLRGDAEIRTVSNEMGIPAGFQGVDIGPKTVEHWKDECKNAKTIFWNGPVGVFEDPRFSAGTFSLANAIADLPGVVTVVGGGDSAAAVHKAGVSSKFSHISTGGGASLEFIELGTLPGVLSLSTI